ncbi:hypothetical protein UFOVP140_42 [uncultured Caudovirales phage]|uniref:Uncharacterized protein n=1 Tax=uncultured Caudovirales phage TaxID=2100421 RepID=A0A6J5LJH9_9CAUD|nr:hypothetical protein UFOVP140_42 [uncultured Caudovirales phage]
MSDLTVSEKRIATMSESAIEKVRTFESLMAERPQEEIGTEHVIHGGMYARTILIPAGVAITGAEIKLATVLVLQGDALAYTDDGAIELHGYNVIPASAGRKQAFVALTDTWLTMIFPTSAQSIEQAEDEFTDEAHMLLTRRGIGKQTIVITGE